MSLDLNDKLRSEEKMVMREEEDVWNKFVRSGHPLKTDAEGVLRRLNDLSPKLFSNPVKMQIDILDIAGKFCLRRWRDELTELLSAENGSSDSRIRSSIVKSVEELSDLLSRKDVPETRFM